jgi:hypothetical protein
MVCFRPKATAVLYRPRQNERPFHIESASSEVRMKSRFVSASSELKAALSQNERLSDL